MSSGDVLSCSAGQIALTTAIGSVKRVWEGSTFVGVDTLLADGPAAPGRPRKPPGPTELDLLFLPRSFARSTQIRRILKRVRVVLAPQENVLDAVAFLRRTATWNPSFPKLTHSIKVIVNPHGGGGTAPRIAERLIVPLLRCAGLTPDVVFTERAGHAIDMGKELDPAVHDGVALVGGDGIVQELVSGLLTRPDWRMLVRRVPICHVACGTSNVLATGLRTNQPEEAAYCMIKHMLRPLDATLVSNGAGLRTISMCGVGYGLPASEWTMCSRGRRRVAIAAFVACLLSNAAPVCMRAADAAHQVLAPPRPPCRHRHGLRGVPPPRHLPLRVAQVQARHAHQPGRPALLRDG